MTEVRRRKIDAALKARIALEVHRRLFPQCLPERLPHTCEVDDRI